MKVIQAGHEYELENRLIGDEEPESQVIRFVNMEPGHEQQGTLTQEVLRVLIDRTAYCNSCLPWVGNDEIIYHLRMALALHEARALVRKTHKGLKIEEVSTSLDGHLKLMSKATGNWCLVGYANYEDFQWSTGFPKYNE